MSQKFRLSDLVARKTTRRVKRTRAISKPRNIDDVNSLTCASFSRYPDGVSHCTGYPHKSVDLLELSNFAQSLPWYGALLTKRGSLLLLEKANVHFRPRRF